MRSVLVIVIIALVGCSSIGYSIDASPIDAARPAIDTTPNYRACDLSTPSSCPAPYDCVVPALAAAPQDPVCLVPCTADSDCAVGYFCNGVNQSADTGAHDYCAANV